MGVVAAIATATTRCIRSGRYLRELHPGPRARRGALFTVPGWMPPSVTQPLQTDDEHEIIRG